MSSKYNKEIFDFDLTHNLNEEDKNELVDFYKLEEYDLHNLNNLGLKSVIGNVPYSFKNLNLSDNFIESFKLIPNVKNINLHNNKLKYITGDIDSSLKILDLSNNELVTFEYIKNLTKNYVMCDLINLKRLFLENNQITELIGSIPKSIKELDLQNNKLSSFTFKFLDVKCGNYNHDSCNDINLKLLYLSNNELEEIKGIIPSSLKELYLDNNKLSKISILNNSLNITILNLNDNQLTSFEFNTNFNTIKYLNICNNELTSFYFISDSVREINLSNNKIISFNLISDSIEYLNLHNNSLESFNISNKNLESLDLSFNNLKKIEGKTRKLISLNLSGNELKSFDVLISKNLLRLDLSDNKLEEVKIDIIPTRIKINLPKPIREENQISYDTKLNNINLLNNPLEIITGYNLPNLRICKIGKLKDFNNEEYDIKTPEDYNNYIDVINMQMFYSKIKSAR